MLMFFGFESFGRKCKHNISNTFLPLHNALIIGWHLNMSSVICFGLLNLFQNLCTLRKVSESLEWTYGSLVRMIKPGFNRRRWWFWVMESKCCISEKHALLLTMPTKLSNWASRTCLYLTRISPNLSHPCTYQSVFSYTVHAPPMCENILNLMRADWYMLSIWILANPLTITQMTYHPDAT